MINSLISMGIAFTIGIPIIWLFNRGATEALGLLGAFVIGVVVGWFLGVLNVLCEVKKWRQNNNAYNND